MMIQIFKIITIISYYLFFAVASTNYCNTLHLDNVRRQLEEFNSATPFTEENGKKHVPHIKVNNAGVATVIVGQGGYIHPMVPYTRWSTKEVHWVTHIYVVDQHGDVIQMKTMDPTAGTPARFSFKVPEGVTKLTAYEFCNIHGLWQGPTLSTGFSLQRHDGICQKDDVPPMAYESWIADFERRQARPPFAETYPYTSNGKHAPHITLFGSKGRVVVGVEGDMHPMIAGDAENPPHWITDIYVLDQDQKIIAFQALDPTYVDIATMVFDIPASATQLTAYEWCNEHGLWKGPTIKVGIEEEFTEIKSNARSNFNIDWIYVGCLLGSMFSILLA